MGKGIKRRDTSLLSIYYRFIYDGQNKRTVFDRQMTHHIFIVLINFVFMSSFNCTQKYYQRNFKIMATMNYHYCCEKEISKEITV